MQLREVAKHGARVLFAVGVLTCVGLLSSRLMDTGEEVSAQMAWHGMESGRARDVRLAAGVERPPERYLADVASARTGPLFFLDKGLATLRIISFLHLGPTQSDGPEHYDPQRRYSYGLELVVRDASRTVIRRQKVWFETRKSKVYQEDGVVMDTSAAYLQASQSGGGEPADQRMMDVDLEAFAGPGHSVEILALSPDVGREDEVEVNLILFARQPRSWDKVAWKMRTVEEEERAVLASRAGLLPWSRMTQEELEEALRYKFMRQTSIREVKMRQLLSTDYRRQVWTEPADGEVVSWAHPMVFNLRGPVRLFARPSVTGSRETLHTESIIVGGEHGLRWSVADREPGASRQGAVLLAELEEGEMGSVAVWLDQHATPERYEFFVNRGRAALGEHPLVRAGGEETGTRIWPDRKKIRVWPLLPEPTTYTLRQEELSMGDGLLVTLRRRPGRTPHTIRYRFPEADVEGEIVLSGAPTLARTERLLLADTGETSPSQTTTDSMVSEPETFRLWIPRGARTMTLEAIDSEPGTHEVFASVSVLEINSDRTVQHRVPYATQLGEDQAREVEQARSPLRWRYAPLIEAPWYTIAPRDAADRIARDQYAYLEAQVRLNWSDATLEALWFGQEQGAVANTSNFASGLTQSVLDAGFEFSREVVPDTRRRFEPIEPRDATRARTRNVMERLPGIELRSEEGAAQLLARWDEFDRVGFPPFHSWRCALPEEWKRGERLEVQYTSPQAGGEVTLSFAGAPRLRQIMRTRSARELFWTGSWTEKRGELSLELRDARKERVEQLAWTNCVPLEADARLSLWRVRRVHELSSRREIVLDVEVTEEEREGWFLHLSGYLDHPSGAEIEVTIDDGEPARREGVVSRFTLARRVLSLTPRGRAPLAESANLSLHGPVQGVIPIGGDLAPGRHTVRIRWMKGGAGGGWLRFYRFHDR